jgi:hypothetical protein
MRLDYKEEADTQIDIVCQWKLSLRDTLSGQVSFNSLSKY